MRKNCGCYNKDHAFHYRFLILDIPAIDVNCIDIGKLLPKWVNGHGGLKF